MNPFLEVLGRGLNCDFSDLLSRYYSTPWPLRRDEANATTNPGSFERGLEFLRDVQLDEAVRHLAQACGEQPDSADARVALAVAQEENGDAGAALAQLTTASQVRPGEPPILFALGLCHEKISEPREAAALYRQAIQGHIPLQPARERLAAVTLALGEPRRAIEQYEALLRDNPQETWLHTALGCLCFRSGQCDRAVEEFQAAIAMEPENWALVDDQVETLVAAGQLQEAVERLRRLIDEQGPFADLYARLADVSGQLGRDDEAIQQYHKALELQPNYLEATVKLATHHLVFGRWDQAAETFHRAAELNDRLLLNYVALGAAQAAAGQEQEAENSFDLAAAIEPNSTLLLTEMAKLQLKSVVAEEFLRRFDASGCSSSRAIDVELGSRTLLDRQLQRHEQAVQRRPGHADLRYRYGVMLRCAQRLEEAQAQLTKALEINPCYVQARVLLGLAQRQRGDRVGGRETLRGVLEVPQESLQLHYGLGVLYTERRRFEETVQEMESSEAPSEKGNIRAGLALALQHMGLMDSAAATWRSLKRI